MFFYQHTGFFIFKRLKLQALCDNSKIFIKDLASFLSYLTVLLFSAVITGFSFICKERFILFQNRLFSITSFLFRLLKWCFLEDLSNNYVDACTQTNLLNLLFNLDLVVIALRRYFDINIWLIILAIFCFRGENSWCKFNII